MKRSEARLFIAKLLTDVFDDEMALKRAAFILLKLEDDLGMRPPYDSSQDDEVDTMEWEPE
jgi:hypothetical protein